MLKGIDISAWQKDMDISKIVADFIIVKATEGNGYINTYYEKQLQQAIDLGKKVGIYHFARNSKNSVDSEIDYFLKYALKYKGVAIPILDWEDTDTSNVTWAKQWLDKVSEAFNCKAWIYMSSISSENRHNWSEVANAGYPLWVAQYKDYGIDYNYDMSNAGNKPNVKHWSNYIMWQWTSVGKLDGYSGNLDCNVFYGDISDWNNLLGNKEENTPSNEIIYLIVKSGSRGNLIKILQEKLIAKGYSCGPDGIDGIFGMDTLNAVKQLQKDARIAVDGVVGKDTWAILNSDFVRPNKKSNEEIANEIMYKVNYGGWGTGETRKQKLTAAGYDYNAIQKIINSKM